MATTRTRVRLLQTEIEARQKELREVRKLTPLHMLCEELHELLCRSCQRGGIGGCSFKVENLRDDRIDERGTAYWELATFLRDETLRYHRITPDERRLYGEDESRAGVERVLTMLDLLTKTAQGYRPLKSESLVRSYGSVSRTLADLAVDAVDGAMGLAPSKLSAEAAAVISGRSPSTGVVTGDGWRDGTTHDSRGYPRERLVQTDQGITTLEELARDRDTVVIGDAIYIGGQKGEAVPSVTSVGIPVELDLEVGEPEADDGE